MALDGFNAAASAAILNNARVSSEARTRGVLLAAFVPGALGLAVPLIMARQAGTANSDTSNTDTGATIASAAPDTVEVPDVTGQVIGEATRTLKDNRLVAVRDPDAVFSGAIAKDRIIRQTPEANTEAALDSEVILTVSAGAPPVAEPAITDIAAAEQRIERKLAKLEGELLAIAKVFSVKLDYILASQKQQGSSGAVAPLAAAPLAAATPARRASGKRASGSQPADPATTPATTATPDSKPLP